MSLDLSWEEIKRSMPPGTVLRDPGGYIKKTGMNEWVSCERPAADKHDAVNHPSHYRQGKIEVIDFIEDQKLEFHLGNVVKYVCRAEHKGKELEDLKKAAWYLNRRIETLQKEIECEKVERLGSRGHS